MQRLALLLVSSFALTTAMPAAVMGQSIGFRLLAQPWNPVNDDDRVYTLVDDSTMISAPIQQAWAEFKPQLQQTLTTLLSSADLFGEGVTLYDVVLGIPDPVLRLEALSGGGPAEPLLARVSINARGASIEATTTTPTFLGSWADPRCFATANLSASVEILVGGDASEPLKASPNDTPVAISISGFSWDSQNFPCDVIKEVVGLFGAEEIIADLVENPENTEAFATTAAAMVESGLADASQLIASAVPSNLIRLGVWVSGVPESAQLVTLYVGVDTPIPDTSPRAAIYGTIRMADGRSAQTLDCTRLPIYAERTTGPRLVVNENGGLGDAPPHVQLATSITCGEVAPDGSRPYTMVGLSSAFRTYFVQTGLEGSITECGESILLDTAFWPMDAGVPTSFGLPYDILVRPIRDACVDLFHVIPGEAELPTTRPPPIEVDLFRRIPDLTLPGLVVPMF